MSSKPLIVPVFVPHAGCPHLCAFCNQSVIAGAGADLLNPARVEKEIAAFLAGCRADSRTSQIAFFGGNFLGLSPETIQTLLETADRFVTEGRIHSLRFSTRPDTITPETLQLLFDYPVRTIEIGAQSMNDDVLSRSRRGHSSADTIRAAGLVREGGYELGLQLMVGLPGDDEEISLESARRAAALSPDFVRIYPTVVVAGSPLARWFKEGRYSPWSLDRAVAQTAELFRFFRAKGIRVIRMGLQATDDLREGETILAGPYHPAFGHLVYSRIFYTKAVALMSELPEAGGNSAATAVFRVHPRAESRFRGLRNENMLKLQAQFNLESVTIQTDSALSMDEVRM